MKAIQIESLPGISHIILNRPSALNAINEEMISEINHMMTEISEDDKVRCVIISGAGRCFSSGYDLKESAQRETTGREEWERVLKKDFEFVMQFWNCKKPTIAAVYGYCLAGAFELAMACDLTIASESAMFGMPEVRFGSGIVAMLAPWVTGPKQAKELLLTGHDKFSADYCYKIGVVNRVVEDGLLIKTAIEVAQQIASSSARSVQLTKAAINKSYEMSSMREALLAALEIDIQIESDESPERLEFNRIRKNRGLQAALEWRDNKFN